MKYLVALVVLVIIVVLIVDLASAEDKYDI